MRQRAFGLALIALIVGIAADAVYTQPTNPCHSSGSAVILKPALRFVGEFADHNATFPNAPSVFVTTKYRLKVYDAMSGNPTSGPFLMHVDVPRAQMTAWPDTTPPCWVSPSIAVPPTVKPWAAMRAFVVPVAGEGMTEVESTPELAPDPFALGQARASAVRVLAVP